MTRQERPGRAGRRQAERFPRAASRILEDPATIHAADPGDMLGRIRDLASQVRDAWTLVRSARLPRELGRVRDVTVLGMGGSAIGGELAAALLAGELRVPMAVSRDYALPAYVGTESLVIASSYSGNTEETLSAFAEARRRGAKILALTTGGTLASECEAAGISIVRFSYEAKPRAALGWSLGLVLGALSSIGLVRDLSPDVETALRDLGEYAGRFDADGEDARAKSLARSFHGRVVGMYGAGVMGVMARRWKGQWNENAKNWSFFDVMSELNHNAVVGFPNPKRAGELVSIVFLRSERDDPRIAKRFEVTGELLRRAGVPFEDLRFGGPSPLAEVLRAVYLGDHVSYYTALLNGADPSPNESIDYLKKRLAESR